MLPVWNVTQLRLMQSQLGQYQLTLRRSEVANLVTKVVVVCGFDPLDLVRQLALILWLRRKAVLVTQ